MEPVKPFSKIVVGVDLSASSPVAVGQAMSVARRSGAPLVLMLVAAVPEPAEGLPSSMVITGDRMRQVLKERLALDRSELEKLRQRLVGQGVEVSHLVVDGIAEGDLAHAAQKAGGDLIVVATHGRTGLKRMLLGSVAEKTVRHATASVLVARGTADVAQGGYHRIVVGTDFSPMSELAVARAASLAAPDATIEVMHAWHVPVDYSMDGSMGVAIARLHEDLAVDVERLGREQVAAWRARGVNLHLTTIESQARVALCERAQAVNADLIVVGSHGRTGLKRLLLGSVAEATVRHAPCSVLVARGGES